MKINNDDNDDVESLEDIDSVLGDPRPHRQRVTDDSDDGSYMGSLESLGSNGDGELEDFERDVDDRRRRKDRREY